MSQYAPKIETIQIPVKKIGALIGPGGKVIKKIQEDTGATIEVDDEGMVFISSHRPGQRRRPPWTSSRA